MNDLQERLSTVSGKILYLKAEKQRIENEKKALEAELLKEGVSDVSKLSDLIKQKEAELEFTKSKFKETLTKFEMKVASLEGKLK